MHVLLAGGLGYIGSLTTIHLLEAGFKVTIVDSLSNSDTSTLDRIEKVVGSSKFNVDFYPWNCNDYEKLKSVFESESIDVVMDFAAFKSVPESVGDPLSYYSNNLNTVINLLRLCDEFKVKGFIYSSSCTVYGEVPADSMPVTEETPLNPMSPYGNTKVIAEEMIEDFVKSNLGMHTKAVILRYFNPIGAHPSGLIGESPKGAPANLVPCITRAAIYDATLSIFGNDYNTKDGTCVRDYVDINDLAEGHIAALSYALNPNSNYLEIFNLGSGSGFTVLECIKEFMRVSGVDLKFKFEGRRPGDIEAIYASNSKALEVLNWYPKRSLGESLKSAWNWQLNFNESKKC